MDIILVTSSFNDEVHGTDDEKKTGCGIILTKPENASRFTKGGKMTDLKEITCEKCKEKLAKKIIRADKKEMAKLLKEERARAKKGIEDEGIIPSNIPTLIAGVKTAFTTLSGAIGGISAPILAVVAVIAVLIAAFVHL